MATRKAKKAAKQLDRAHKAQNPGRPKLAGDRYPGGKLKPRKNERLIAAKQAFVGAGMDIVLADDPLEFIHAKGWLSHPRYLMAITYAQVRARANMGAPGMDAGGVQETAPTIGLDVRLSEMTDTELATVFDAVFRDVPMETREDREAKAMARWKKLDGAMTADQRREVQLITIQKSWAWWITDMHAGKIPPPTHMAKRTALEQGLDAMRAVDRPVAPQTSAPAHSVAYESAPAPPPAKVEEALRFVDETGDEIEMASSRGKTFTVSRKMRA